MNSNQDDNMQEQIEAYLNNTLSIDEKIAFEKLIQEDKALQEEINLYKALQESLNENDWHTIDKNKNKVELLEIKKELKSKPIQDVSKHIKKIEEHYFNNKKANKSKRFYTIAIAASILLCVSIGLPFLFSNHSLEGYYNNYQDWEDIPSLTEKGTHDESFKIETLFAEKDYRAIIEYYEKNQSTKNMLHPYTLLKVGSAYFYTGNYDSALKIFDEFIALDTMDRSRGYWYKLLVYLKQENKTKVEEMLKIILANTQNHNHIKAKKIAEEIK